MVAHERHTMSGCPHREHSPDERRVACRGDLEKKSPLEAQALVEDWRIEYNTVRPHSVLVYLTPTEFAKAWTTNHPAPS
jgi:transposase InsO family protein